MDALIKYKPTIDEALAAFVGATLPSIPEQSRLQRQIKSHILEFATNGKTLRGCLSMFSHDAYGGDDNDASLTVAVALELIQSGLLIHDDVYDRDQWRRGKHSTWHHFSSLAQDAGYAEYKHFGESVAVNIGDTCYFLAHLALASLDTQPDVKGDVERLIAKEIAAVSMAQVQDLELSQRPLSSIRTDDIISLYEAKTARYSIALPMLTGAILAGKSSQETSIRTFAKHAGLLFQITDDELSLFGKKEHSGKPTGGDIVEGKKTLYIHHVYHHASPGEKKRIVSVLEGKIRGDATSQILELLQKHKIKDVVGELKLSHAQLASRAIAALDISKENKQVLEAFISHLVSRKK